VLPLFRFISWLSIQTWVHIAFKKALDMEACKQLLAYWKRQRAPALHLGGTDRTGWFAASLVGTLVGDTTAEVHIVAV
jgi:hypothetical protein